MIDSVHAPFAAISQDRSQAAKAWKGAGGKVLGYLSNNIPLEIIHAAGILPFHLVGDPDQSPELADQFMEPAFDPGTRSILNRLLRGDFDFLDLIVLPRTNDSQQRLYYYLCEIKRKHPQFALPPVYLLDLLHSPRDSTARHNLTKFQDFTDFIGEQAGGTVSEPSLKSAIADYNSVRRQLQRFTESRGEANSSISSLLAYQVYAAAQSLSVTDFSRALSELIGRIEDGGLPAASGKRVLLAGNGLDHPALHQWLDELGATVVGDYHSLGNHFLVSQVDENMQPLAALSQHYHRETKSCRSFRPDPMDVVNFALRQQARGILFFYVQREEALTWHYPRQQQAAQAAGLQTLVLNDQPYQFEPGDHVAAVQEFLQIL